MLKLTTFFNVTIGPANGEVSLLGTTETVDYPTDTWGDIVIEAGNNQEIRLNNLETTQLIRLSSVHLSLKLKEDNVLDGKMMEIYVVVYICQVLDASIGLLPDLHEADSCKEIVLLTHFGIPQEYNSSEPMHCIGICDGVRCNQTPKKHTLYCEHHLPNWLKRM
ncbi:hypothetical protein Tco_0753230 [Tanacetum coccineum]